MSERNMREIVIDALTQVAPEIDPDTIEEDAELAEQLDLDSMDMLGVIVAISERTGVEIPERDYPKLARLTDAVTYLNNAAAAAQDPSEGPRRG